MNPPSPPPEPPQLSDVRAARVILEAKISPTRLIEVPLSSDSVRLFLKLECEQVSGSFKARGARHYLARLLETPSPGSETIAGVITYSSGNHGRAVAEAANAAGIRALITVPDQVDASKEAAMREAGAEVVRAGVSSESRRVAAVTFSEERGWPIIPPFDHPWIIAGQATCTLEIVEALPDLVGLWVPVGGGGLAAGAATVLRDLAPECQLHLVEPEGASSFGQSQTAGERVRLESTDSIADGLLPLQLGRLNWEVLSQSGARSELVSDEQITRNLRRLREFGAAAEPSAAVSSAPLFESGGVDWLTPGVHCAIVSGGNVDPQRLERLLARTP